MKKKERSIRTGSGGPGKGKPLSKKALRKKRIRTAKSAAGWVGFSMALFLIIFSVAANLDPVAGELEMDATVVEFKGAEAGSAASMKIELEDGNVVAAAGWVEKPLTPGRKVVVVETKTRIFKNKRYRLVKVIETPDQTKQENNEI